MDDAVSQKGTKTAAREATHGAALASNKRCPTCGSRHVLKTQSTNGRKRGAFMCGSCGAFFSEAA